MMNQSSDGKKKMLMTTKEKNSYRNHQQKTFKETARDVEFNVQVPHYLHGSKYSYQKSIYLKNNMDQMKVIKKCKELQPGKYTNDRGYIFYCPTTDAPLDKRIMESGGRVFEYNVQHQ